LTFPPSAKKRIAILFFAEGEGSRGQVAAGKRGQAVRNDEEKETDSWCVGEMRKARRRKWHVIFSGSIISI
jgi:hypothetical protein